MNSQDNAQAGLFDWGTPAWMQPDPESTPTSDRANGDVGHAIGHVVSRGFTERQARFLLLVARHSGVCVMRQYATFGGVVFGHTTRRFFAKLERLGWVSTYDCARKRARIYHVRHRELYEAIGAPESRLRRPPTVPRALERWFGTQRLQVDLLLWRRDFTATLVTDGAGQVGAPALDHR